MGLFRNLRPPGHIGGFDVVTICSEKKRIRRNEGGLFGMSKHCSFGHLVQGLEGQKKRLLAEIKIIETQIKMVEELSDRYNHKPVNNSRNGISNSKRKRILKKYGYECVHCGGKIQDKELEIDHIIPVVYGGGNEDSNLQVLCSSCNQIKGAKIEAENRKDNPFLCPGCELRSVCSDKCMRHYWDTGFCHDYKITSKKDEERR
jgi:hypothetical protein